MNPDFRKVALIAASLGLLLSLFLALRPDDDEEAAPTTTVATTTAPTTTATEPPATTTEPPATTAPKPPDVVTIRITVPERHRAEGAPLFGQAGPEGRDRRPHRAQPTTCTCTATT